MEFSSSAPQFVCPGSAQSVTRAIHLARLNAAWPICDQCDWRLHTEGLAERTVQETERIRELRAHGIRRTEFGIRGQYINELDRRTVSDLVQVFCSGFHRQAHPQPTPHSPGGRLRIYQPLPDSEPPNLEPALSESATIIAGYDGRSSSPDIFVGAVTTIREYGLRVIDIGRCTAASIHEAARTFECSGAIFVTGSGQAASWTGLDVIDRHGDPVAVIWKEFGIVLHHSVSRNKALSNDVGAQVVPGRDDRVADLFLRLREGNHPGASEEAASVSGSFLRLELPPQEIRKAWSRRLTRQSGTHHIEDFESRYRLWLARWFPDQSSARVLVRCDDPLIRQRCTWLSERTGVEIIVRPTREEVAVPSCAFTIEIPEDDRECSIRDVAGTLVSAVPLADQLNKAIRSGSSQLTAHADSVTGRFWFSDARRSDPARGDVRGMTEQIRDSLAVLGMVLKLTESGRLTLTCRPT